MADATSQRDFYQWAGDGHHQPDHWTNKCVIDTYGRPSQACADGGGKITPAPSPGKSENVFPQSSTKDLIAQDLAGKSAHDLWYGRNEIYARHGYKFQTKELNDTFHKQSWYKENPNFKESDLNQIEKNNIDAIKKQENVVGLSGSPANNVAKTDNTYCLKDPQVKLKEEDLTGLSADQLRIVRNEIFARHGLSFQSTDLQQYFGAKTWYKPDPHFKDDLSQVERENVQLLKAREDKLRVNKSK